MVTLSEDQESNEETNDEEVVDFTRASGLAVCPHCERIYFKHPKHPKYSWLVVACDSRLLKL